MWRTSCRDATTSSSNRFRTADCFHCTTARLPEVLTAWGIVQPGRQLQFTLETSTGAATSERGSAGVERKGTYDDAALDDLVGVLVQPDLDPRLRLKEPENQVLRARWSVGREKGAGEEGGRGGQFRI
jgi:hypothetical protein